MYNHEIINYVPKLQKLVLKKMAEKNIKPYTLSKISKNDVAIVYRFLNKTTTEITFNSAYKFMKALDISLEDLEREEAI